MEGFYMGDGNSWKEYLEENDGRAREEIGGATRKGLVLGPKEFIDRLESSLGITLGKVKVGRPALR
jgi:hypothetical protein